MQVGCLKKMCLDSISKVNKNNYIMIYIYVKLSARFQTEQRLIA